MATPPNQDTTVPGVDPGQGTIDQFQVTLDNFEGPFDLLLQLIARHRLDITEIALAAVTDEFIAHMQAYPDLSKTTEFLVVAATLLDMKAASLLPAPETGTNESQADLEARDLLFSRLLQYRAFKLAGQEIGARLDTTSGYVPRNVSLEPQFAALLPELVWTVTPQMLVRAAADALTAQPPEVQVTHLHDPVVPVAGQLYLIAAKLQERRAMTFSELVADADSLAVVVSRFLALLELFRGSSITFDQSGALAPLTVIWTGEGNVDTIAVDEYAGSDEEAP